MNDIELSSVMTERGNDNGEFNGLLSVDSKVNLEEVSVNTRYGKVLVTVQGDLTKTPFLTYPDIGLTSNLQYHGFFNYEENIPVMDKFCAIHINPPGQENNATTYPKNYSYPSCDQQSEIVMDVVNHFRIKGVICFGVGQGANVLARFALSHPDFVSGCVFINLVSTKCGWVEWGYQKWSNWYLGSGQYTEFTKNYLLWHHFGYHTWEKCHDLIETYSRIFSRINPVNLSHLITSYINRTDLGIQRKDFEATTPNPFNFKMPIMNVMGDMTPHDEDVVDTNGRLDPTNSSFVKMQDCGGMVLEEQPAKMAECIRHFLQGMGHLTNLSVTKHSLANRNAVQAVKMKELLKKSACDEDMNVQGTVNLDMPYSSTVQA